jgi:3-oxoacyl-(acyl-carrier-protein) synthase
MGGGIERAMRDALCAGGFVPSDVGAIYAHATGTPQNDSAEARAITNIFADSLPPVVAIKATVGHAMGAAPALGAVCAIQSIVRGVLPPSLTDWEPSRDCDIPLTTASREFEAGKVIVNNGSGFGGINSSIVVSAPHLEKGYSH